ncbi:ATP-dependent permease YOR1 [Trichinella spiralis]|uniref:ATP-dependent permease YOR1 n=1 Tax=Trichinella spiralis TaxID=6334 RepID=A0ABR3KHU9_TRISP
MASKRVSYSARLGRRFLFPCIAAAWASTTILLITLLLLFSCRSSETRLLRYYGPCSCYARRLLCSIGDRALLCCAGRLTHRRDLTLDSVLDLYNCAQYAQAFDAPGVFFGSDGIFNSLTSNVEYQQENSKLKASCGIQLEVDNICGQTINPGAAFYSLIRVFFFSTSSVSYASFCLFFAQRNVTDKASELQLTLSGIPDEVLSQLRISHLQRSNGT